MVSYADESLQVTQQARNLLMNLGDHATRFSADRTAEYRVGALVVRRLTVRARP